jgi:hypothetical protein
MSTERLPGETGTGAEAATPAPAGATGEPCPPWATVRGSAKGVGIWPLPVATPPSGGFRIPRICTGPLG